MVDNPPGSTIPRHIGSPRILIVGEFGAAYPCSYFARSFRDAGWQVVELDFAKFFPRYGRGPLARVAGRLLAGEAQATLAAAVENSAAVNAVDCVFFTKAVGASASVMQSLKQRNILSICWYPDFGFDHVIIDQTIIFDFDIFITTKDFHIPYLEYHRPDKINVLIEHGYCDDAHWRAEPVVPWERRSVDVVFVGNHSSYKQDWLVGLVERRPDWRAMIVGDRWQQVRWPAAAANVTISPALVGDSMARVINDARVAVAVHHGPTGNAEGWQDSVSARTFEIPACGTPMVHIAGDHLPSLFDISSELLCFEDVDGLVASIDQLLSDPVQAMAMAERAYRRAVPAYGYMARGREIVDVVARHCRAAGQQGQ